MISIENIFLTDANTVKINRNYFNENLSELEWTQYFSTKCYRYLWQINFHLARVGNKVADCSRQPKYVA